ncbi:MAG: radical SAM family heme chaperone HemW, partial [Burkholderiales bacterium]|nr:radical SAM family heme chaperone HemW [Burkholderiales bacterium]
FNSHEARQAMPEREYIAALTADLDHALPRVWGRKVYSVFFGGGTPSLFSPQGIDAILSMARARLPLAADAEITLEANPGTFEAEKFRAYRDAGVNRLSIGIQSFNAAHLRRLGRIPDADEARGAVEIAKRHFDNVNLDLMYGLPGQTVEDALADIDAALSFAPEHVSAYHLTIEPNTYFHRYPPVLPDDDIAAAMQDAIEARLAAAGYEHYEVSAYARLREAKNTAEDGNYLSILSPLSSRAQRRCAHNLNYWLFGDYLGIGAGAHSKLSMPDAIVREMRCKQPKQYIQDAAAGRAVQQTQPVDAREVGFEFMMNALRLTEGFTTELFAARAGLPLTTVLRELEEAERRKLIARDHRRIVPTPLGRQFLNDLLQIFLKPAA